jgi:putative membrane protein
MKRLFITAGLACALALPAVAAQTGQAKPPSGSGTTQKTAPQKVPPAKKGTAQTGTSGKSAAPHATGGTLAPADRHFVTEAAVGGLAEVELGKMAVDKASNADVKQFGQRMVDDHSKANDELRSWASSNGVTLPPETGATEKAVENRLSKLSGDAFDRAYMSAMVQDHTKDVAAFQQASKTAKNADLKAWAGKTLPTLQDHKKMAQDVKTKLGPGTAVKKTPKH